MLRAVEGGLALAWTPLVLVGMNLVYALAAYPFGKLSDRVGRARLLALGLALLIAADLALAAGSVCPGSAVASRWGLHLAVTQGLLATLVADSAPADLRGTAFGLFNLVSGIAMLVASALAGWLWDGFGATATFLAGAVFSTLALGVLAAAASGARRPAGSGGRWSPRRAAWLAPWRRARSPGVRGARSTSRCACRRWPGVRSRRGAAPPRRRARRSPRSRSPRPQAWVKSA